MPEVEEVELEEWGRSPPAAEGGGRVISRSGWENRDATEAACVDVGVSARRLVGRLERGSCEVGIDSGIGSDIFGLVGEMRWV